MIFKVFFETNLVPEQKDEHLDIKHTLEIMETLVERSFGKKAPVYTVYFKTDFPNPQCYRITTPQIIILATSPLEYREIPYQFFHELCHLMIGEGTPKKFKWFEESLCALSTIYFMLRYEIESNLNLSEYLAINCQNFELFETSELLDPHTEITYQLENNEYDREKNKWIALNLLPIAQKYGPNFWRFFSSLHVASSDLTFQLLIHFLAQKAITNNILSLPESMAIFGDILETFREPSNMSLNKLKQFNGE